MAKSSTKRTKQDWITIFNIHYGKTTREIATVLGITIGGVHEAIKRNKINNALKTPVRRSDDWIKLHNDNKKLSIEEIALKTGINKYTIAGGFYRNDLR